MVGGQGVVMKGIGCRIGKQNVFGAAMRANRIVELGYRLK